jgi:hypothetical protein
MTDHDRGAYTPPTDEALAFDARRQSERRPVPMTLVGSAVVLVVLIVGVAVVYRGGVRGADEAPRPIGQPVVSVKTPPPAVATLNTVGAGQDGETKSAAVAPAPAPAVAAPAPPATGVVTTASAPPPPTKPAPRIASSTDRPTFTPAPEQPAPRPEPAAKSLALLDRPSQAIGLGRVRVAPPPGKPIRSAGGLDASEVAAAGMTGAAPAHTASATSPTTAPFKVAKATSKPGLAKPTFSRPSVAIAAGPKSIDAALADASKVGASKVGASSAGASKLGASPVAAGPVVQIGAFSSAALSDQGYADVSRIMVGQMVGKAKHVMTVDHGGATLFRTWVSGFATRAEASAFCDALKARSKPCFVKG